MHSVRQSLKRQSRALSKAGQYLTIPPVTQSRSVLISGLPNDYDLKSVVTAAASPYGPLTAVQPYLDSCHLHYYAAHNARLSANRERIIVDGNEYPLSWDREHAPPLGLVSSMQLARLAVKCASRALEIQLPVIEGDKVVEHLSAFGELERASQQVFGSSMQVVNATFLDEECAFQCHMAISQGKAEGLREAKSKYTMDPAWIRPSDTEKHRIVIISHPPHNGPKHPVYGLIGNFKSIHKGELFASMQLGTSRSKLVFIWAADATRWIEKAKAAAPEFTFECMPETKELTPHLRAAVQAGASSSLYFRPNKPSERQAVFDAFVKFGHIMSVVQTPQLPGGYRIRFRSLIHAAIAMESMGSSVNHEATVTFRGGDLGFAPFEKFRMLWHTLPYRPAETH